MDVYRLAKAGLTEEEGYWIAAGGDPDELAQLHEITLRMLAEADLQVGEVVNVTREGSSVVSAWLVTCAHEAGDRPPVDVIAAGNMRSVLLTGDTWARALGETECHGVCLQVAVRGVGLCLRLAEDADLARHYDPTRTLS